MTTFAALIGAIASAPGLEGEIVGGFATHERDDAVRTRRQLDVSHHRVADDAGHQSDHPAAGGRAAHSIDVEAF
jgi:hypothetical protein